MFESEPYLTVNREERFFCFLFAHALLASPSYRRRMIGLLNSRFKTELLDSELEVYIEVAALRDYWNSLGKPREYSPETHKKRLDVIKFILKTESIDYKVIDKNEVFWTGKPGSKLWSPGRWDVKMLEEANLGQLKPIRWAFNAKPDILLLSSKAGLVIEAKVESGEGFNEESGYDQIDIQRLIIRLWRTLIPGFADIRQEPITLKLTNDTHGLTWKEIMPLKSDAGVDDFTRRGLAELKRYG